MKLSRELKAAAAADFSSLNLEEKHVFVTAAICITRCYCLDQVRDSRRLKKELMQDHYKWASYLNTKELMMMGDLDHEEAKNLYKKSIKSHSKFISFEGLLRKKETEHVRMGKYEPLEKYSSSYYDGAIFADTKLNDKNNKKACSETRCKLDPEERKNMLANVESYRIKMEQAMKNRMRKKTEFNQADDDDGACSDTRFNQSDEGN